MKGNKSNYYSLVQEGNTATLNIFGDIVSYAWESLGEVSNYLLSKKIEEMGDVSIIDVYINSYGGEVAEGLAIYNALKRHKAKIRTHVDGFACSIASVIFMSGDERIMPSASCLMIHNPWMVVGGNAKELRKQADDLDVIGECAINAYLECLNISKEELMKLLDNETWLSPKEAIEMGFATEQKDEVGSEYANQSVKEKVIKMLLSKEPNNKSNNEPTTIDETDEKKEEEQENNEDAKKAQERAIDIVSSFLIKMEKEILK